MHMLMIQDARGDVVDVLVFCSNACHAEHAAEHGLSYDGWNGAHESDSTEWCVQCGTVASVGIEDNDACDCLRNNVVVNRFRSETGERCEHGNFIQLPMPVEEED
jgi:hypothetical protein